MPYRIQHHTTPPPGPPCLKLLGHTLSFYLRGIALVAVMALEHD